MINRYKNEIYLIFFLSLILFTFKWFLSYWNYGFENIFTKFIFNPSEDYSYYPFIKNLAEFNFSEGYSPIFNNLKMIGFPFLVSIIHAIFYLVFDLYGIILLEIIFIFLFLLIFFLIFKELEFSNRQSVFFSFLFYSIPQILFFLNDFSIPYIFNLKQLYSSFYSLRFPRPLVTNLFFFSFLFFVIKFYKSKEINYSKKYLYFSGIFIGLQLNSFFFFSILTFILTVALFLLKFGFYKCLKIYYKNFLFFLSIIITVSLPFLIQIFFVEPDYLQRVGTYEITELRKSKLINHLIYGFSKPEFLILSFINVIFYIFNIKKIKNSKPVLDVFLAMYLISILIPFVYLYTINFITFFSNFISIILICGFLLLKINLLFLLNTLQINFKKIKPKFIFLFCYLFLIFFNFNYLYKTSHVKILSPDVHFVPKDIDTFRKDFNEIIGFYETNKKFLNEKSLLLTNDIQIQLWWIFLDNKYFYFPYVFFVSLSDDMVETQLINAFKYFNLNQNDFINFFNQNKLTNWRVVNTNNYFFLGHIKYQANSIVTFNNKLNYPKNVQNYILQSTIHHTNQIILPISEVERLKTKFKNTKVLKELKPEIIIINKNENLHVNLINNKLYCKKLENNNFIILFTSNNNICSN